MTFVCFNSHTLRARQIQCNAKEDYLQGEKGVAGTEAIFITASADFKAKNMRLLR